MSRNRRPVRTLAGAAGAVVLTGLLLSGCGAGQISQTAQQVAATNGVNTSVGSVDLRDVQIAYPEAPAGGAELYAPGSSAPLRATLVNSGSVADRLVSVSSPAAANVLVDGDPVLPQDVALVSAGNFELTPTAARPLNITLEGLTRPIRAGENIPITFVFERAGSVTAQVPAAVPTEDIPHGPGPERDDFSAEAEAVPAPPELPVDEDAEEDQDTSVTDGEGVESAPGNEGSGAGGVAGN
ncbi:copper chaperone PCu(A)C [Pseudonocardia sp. NPDC049635]|uniref:copper chaperone PCu(A)C n=1 Tax=Pseudonocardia sp. NPDC049635 TaxID=3155506 RepID=UPI0033F72A78